MIIFFSYLDESSYFMDETGEIIITTPIIQYNGNFQIDIPIRISSNCNTVIKCNKIQVSSEFISLSSISFETSLNVEETKEFSITNCTIKNAKTYIISSCEKVTISNLTITGGYETALTIQNSIVNADNLSFCNVKSSMMICNLESVVFLKNCNFTKSEAGSLYVFSQTNVEIENCTFSDAGTNFIYLTNSQISIKNCTFQNASKSAIVLKNSTDFLIEKNQFSNVKETAIFTELNSSGTIIGNKISECEGNGINVHDTKVLINENTIENAIYPAILLFKSTATLQNNKIKKIIKHGICIRNDSNATLEGNEINDCDMCGISISDTNSCFIQNNTINNCKHSAIEVFNNSKVVAKNNTIADIDKSAFSLFFGSSIDAEENKISNVKEAMTKLAFKSGGNFINNIVNNCKIQLEGETSSLFFFSGNSDFENLTNDKSKTSEKIRFDDRAFDEKNVLCLKCHKNKRDTFLFPCCHKLMCKKCAEESLADIQKKFVCPLCNFVVSKVSTGINVDEDNLCIKCMENKIDCIILPCGHFAACSTCLSNWFEKHNNCPVCRNENSEFLKIYNDF